MSYRTKRKIIIVLGVLFALFIGLVSPLAVRVWAAEEDPFTEIGTAQELKALAAAPSRWGGNYKLTANIDLNGNDSDQWTPIGNYFTRFSGIFDGGDHTISGLYISGTSDYQGLFGYVENGTVRNLHVSGSVIAGGNQGGIVGTLYPGTVENCSFEGTVEGGRGTNASDMDIGGIVGRSHNGTIRNCSNYATVSCGSMYGGGIVGMNEGSVENCANFGRVVSTDSFVSDMGGIAGFNNKTITNCYNSGQVDCAVSYGAIGGIAGESNSAAAVISLCYNVGLVIGGTYYTGGIVGENYTNATLTQCYNLGAVSGTSCIGGITGQNDSAGVTTNCYNVAAVSGSTFIGGIVGRNHNNGSSRNFAGGVTTNCYNKGTVTGNKSNSGSVVGQNVHTNGAAGTVSNCYYLTGTISGGIAGSDIAGQAEVKTAAKFNSGEVAWLLQSGNADNGVWGQELVKSSRDEYPLLIAVPEGADGAPDGNRTEDSAVPVVARVSFFVPNGDGSAHMQLTENASGEYYVQYSNRNGTQGEGVGKIKMPTHASHTDVPEMSQDEGPIQWLVNDPNGGHEFDTVAEGDILWDGSKYNEINLYVKWDFSTELPLGCLTIKAVGGANARFLYRVTGTADDGSKIDLTVSVKGGGAISIFVPLGVYTVTEISDWSWRYGDGVAAGADWETDGKSATTTIEEDSDSAYGGQEKTVTYSHERNRKGWLGGER